MTSRSDLPWQVGTSLKVEVLEALADGRGTVCGIAPAVLERSEAGRAALNARIAGHGVVYGVTTGFGDSCEVPVLGEDIQELPTNLFRFHGCGVGPALSRQQSRAIIVARLASLAGGFSAVRSRVFHALIDLLTHDIVPVIPAIGSVGASGDLTPLSYVAAVLSGERVVHGATQNEPAFAALAAAGLLPICLEPKESLALMNGTSAMTGIAALCLPRVLRLCRWSAALTAACSDVLRGQPGHFDARLFAAKPHPGQALVATWLREDLEFTERNSREVERVQDRYSLRCAPHVLGVTLDLLPVSLSCLEIELNGASDNPLVDPETGDVLHGGNFYGGHVCAVMDLAKTQVANISDLMDRQLALLCNPVTNAGLPANLVGAPRERRAAHHGFKAMQITASALAAEAAKLTMPASVFSRSTENHNQDKVSMGTMAARDCDAVLALAETTAAILTLACAQAVDLRERRGCHRRALLLWEAVRDISPFVTADRALDTDILAVMQLMRTGSLPVGRAELNDFR